MRRSALTLRVTFAALVAGASASAWGQSPTTATTDTFVFVDRLAVDEIEEVTTVTIDGATVRSFHLDAERPIVEFDVSVGRAETHVYGLCGHLLIREADGTERRVAVDVTGELDDVAGRRFEAIATNNFSRVFLVDVTDPSHPINARPLRERACAPAVSELLPLAEIRKVSQVFRFRNHRHG